MERRFRSENNRLPSSCGEILLVLDTSGSMSCSDYPPSRLRGAIEAGVAFVREKEFKAPDDAVGVVGFSSELTSFFGPAKAGSQAPEIVRALYALESGGGTDYCVGLKKAADIFKISLNGSESSFLRAIQVGLDLDFGKGDARKKPRKIVFLSDGFNGGDDPLPLCRKLQSKSVHISCIGVGGGAQFVDEVLLKAMASKNAVGEPCYRFIRDTGSLVAEFKKLANIRMV